MALRAICLGVMVRALCLRVGIFIVADFGVPQCTFVGEVTAHRNLGKQMEVDDELGSCSSNAVLVSHLELVGDVRGAERFRDAVSKKEYTLSLR